MQAVIHEVIQLKLQVGRDRLTLFIGNAYQAGLTVGQDAGTGNGAGLDGLKDARIPRFVGAEMDPAHHAIAMKRLARGHTPDMFGGA